MDRNDIDQGLDGLLDFHGEDDDLPDEVRNLIKLMQTNRASVVEFLASLS